MARYAVVSKWPWGIAGGRWDPRSQRAGCAGDQEAGGTRADQPQLGARRFCRAALRKHLRCAQQHYASLPRTRCWQGVALTLQTDRQTGSPPSQPVLAGRCRSGGRWPCVADAAGICRRERAPAPRAGHADAGARAHAAHQGAGAGHHAWRPAQRQPSRPGQRGRCCHLSLPGGGLCQAHANAHTVSLAARQGSCLRHRTLASAAESRRVQNLPAAHRCRLQAPSQPQLHMHKPPAGTAQKAAAAAAPGTGAGPAAGAGVSSQAMLGRCGLDDWAGHACAAGPRPWSGSSLAASSVPWGPGRPAGWAVRQGTLLTQQAWSAGPPLRPYSWQQPACQQTARPAASWCRTHTCGASAAMLMAHCVQTLLVAGAGRAGPGRPVRLPAIHWQRAHQAPAGQLQPGRQRAAAAGCTTARASQRRPSQDDALQGAGCEPLLGPLLQARLHAVGPLSHAALPCSAAHICASGSARSGQTAPQPPSCHSCAA